MKNIIVTTPKTEMKHAAEEAEYAKKNPGTQYYRFFPNCPKHCKPDSKVFYVEDWYIRGFAIVDSISAAGDLAGCISGPTQRGYYVFMNADSWKWTKPIPMKGFQGFRYFDGEYEVVGDWLDPKPEV